ncbi:winged helix-turn-helix domain-containing protein [Streptomyces sp. ID05-04B]|uniref:winged helix-turn-helix domain-containing protein n=1 Tax=Streptomyces sp. ID05-04B TaxID=3028661 RepID=UPI0029C36BC8|nr:winged helix-turn-helix domain-containing protein [Streptomyces sp. ID05-04B]MDX5568748.1 winged helix-turn-helix domain-containing protein [Streptomyces sp. ID05-04B]
MRYAQGGGLTDAGRAAREQIRLQAVEGFEGGQKSREIAAALRVSERSVERWRRQWRERGKDGVLSKGSPGRPRLSDTQIARLERELERGPLIHGWVDQRWTLARIKTPIGRLFHVSYTVKGTWLLLKRHGWSWQQPARRAIERDDTSVEVWKKETWPQVRASRRSGGPGSSLSCAVRRCDLCGGERPSLLTCRSRKVELRAA